MGRPRSILLLALAVPALGTAQTDSLNRYVTENQQKHKLTLDAIPDRCILTVNDQAVAFGFGVHLARVVPGQSFDIVIPNMPSFSPFLMTHASVDVKGNWPIGLWTQPAQFNVTFSDGDHSGTVTAIGENYIDGPRAKTLPEKVVVTSDLWGGFPSSPGEGYTGGGEFKIHVEMPTLGSDNFGSQVQQVTDVRLYFVFGSGPSQVLEMGRQIAKLGLFALMTGV